MATGIAAYHPQPRLQKFVRLVALLLLILPAVSLPAGTQADAAKSKSAQAVLHIQVRVVPVAQLPLTDSSNPARGPVVYNIATSAPPVDGISESRPLAAGAAGGSGAASKNAWLETVTVVPR